MPNPEISSIYINSTTYDLKDATARTMIQDLGTVVEFKSVLPTSADILALTTAEKGDLYIAQDDGSEWICVENLGGTADPTKWQELGIVTQELGDLAYVDTTTASYTPAGSVTITPATITVNSITAVGTLPSYTQGTFSAGTLPSFTRGTFSAGTLPSFTQGTFNAGSLPSWSASVTGEVLSFSWSAGSLPSHASDTFSAGTLPSHAADTFSAGTLPSHGDDSFSAGTLPTKGSNQTVMTGASASFSGTAATITGEPTE